MPMGIPVAEATASASPPTTAVDEACLSRFRAQLEREATIAADRLTGRLGELEERETRRFRRSLEASVAQAQARVNEAAQRAVDEKAGPAVRYGYSVLL